VLKNQKINQEIKKNINFDSNFIFTAKDVVFNI